MNPLLNNGTNTNQNENKILQNEKINYQTSSPHRYISSGGGVSALSSTTQTINRLNSPGGTIALSTSSPLIAKYMNLNQSLNCTNNLQNYTTNIDRLDSSTSNTDASSSVSILNNSVTVTTTTTCVTSAITPVITTASCTVTKISPPINTILNPDGYLSAKLNQTRAAREAFLRGSQISANSIATTNNLSVNSVVNSTTSLSISSTNTNITQNQSNPSSNSINNGYNRQVSHNSRAYVNIDSKPAANLAKSLDNNTNEYSNASNVIVDSIKLNGIQNTVNNNTNNENILRDKTNNQTTPKVKNLEGYVGFVNLPNQVYRKAVKKGFEFNLMIVGESGLGKSTFINSLFMTELYNADEFPGTFERKKKTVHVDSSTVLLTEKGVNLRLTIVDTPGFGENIDNTNCWDTIVDYIDLKYEEYLNSESRVSRKPIIDDRIHCCLYFIAPGHSLKKLDIEVMRKLHDRVNLIPIIAKADTMTLDEILNFKKTILHEINENKIEIYEFPDVDDDDIEMNKTNNLLKSKLPFAIVGSNTILEIDGKPIRGRKYPWGFVNVDDLSHCDFMALRTMLIRTHMQDLKDVTNNVHYENYRYKKLSFVAGDKNKLPNNKNPFQYLEEERKDAELRLAKMKAEMEAVFEQKVKEKIARMKESETNLEKQQDAMKSSLEKEEKELEQQRLTFLKEKQLWEEANREEEERLRQTLDKEFDKKKKKIF